MAEAVANNYFHTRPPKNHRVSVYVVYPLRYPLDRGALEGAVGLAP